LILESKVVVLSSWEGILPKVVSHRSLLESSPGSCSRLVPQTLEFLSSRTGNNEEFLFLAVFLFRKERERERERERKKETAKSDKINTRNEDQA
jgi:hypothetical protein